MLCLLYLIEYIIFDWWIKCLKLLFKHKINIIKREYEWSCETTIEREYKSDGASAATARTRERTRNMPASE